MLARTHEVKQGWLYGPCRRQLCPYCLQQHVSDTAEEQGRKFGAGRFTDFWSIQESVLCLKKNTSKIILEVFKAEPFN